MVRTNLHQNNNDTDTSNCKHSNGKINTYNNHNTKVTSQVKLSDQMIHTEKNGKTNGSSNGKVTSMKNNSPPQTPHIRAIQHHNEVGMVHLYNTYNVETYMLLYQHNFDCHIFNLTPFSLQHNQPKMCTIHPKDLPTGPGANHLPSVVHTQTFIQHPIKASIAPGFQRSFSCDGTNPALLAQNNGKYSR